MQDFTYEIDSDGIVTVTMDMQGQNANTMNKRFEPGMRAICDRLETQKGLSGVVFASAKSTFFAGGDLHDILATETADQETFDFIEANKAVYRRLEKLPVPVACAINGAALGGGYELCLASNFRVVVDDPKAVVGLPEVTLGLLPGAGGVVRLTAKLGLQAALPYLLEGTQVRPADALAAGMVDRVVPTRDDLIPAAKAWINANADSHTQPWDQKGVRYPGGDALPPKVRQTIMASSAMLSQKTRGRLPAPEKILDVAVCSMRMSFDAALRMETRRFIGLMASKEAKAAISTFFFGMQAVKSGKVRPEGDHWKATSAAVLGAGMMGSGIAYAHAKRGLPTLLKDTELASAEKGRRYSEALCDKAIKRGHMDEAGKEKLLEQITPATENAEPGSVDIVIEAVFEDLDLKEKVIADTWPMLSDAGIYGSNTSTLPISVLAEACPDPSRFIGLHFFSPVDKMKVVEIVVGEKTSDETLRKAYDYVQQIGYMPIVVKDSRGFFTSRVFGTYLDEGCQLLTDGVVPSAIERAAWLAGMPVGPLQVFDEVSLVLSQKVRQTHAALDARDGAQGTFGQHNSATAEVTDRMIELGRGGRQYGGGFYDYDAEGNRRLWEGLTQFATGSGEVPLQDAIDRVLYRQAIETLRCLDEGVLQTEVEANLGGILAIGFPAHTGGAIQFIRGIGIDTFAARARALAGQYGSRFAVPDAIYDRLRDDQAQAA
ncbi:MAG: 3-hydroxyacyl-CoA dehydrogenase NAD-binding domain-containing protein [Sulfitobacter sp.]|nr:3-hydroxyacyl-CoA dehydrogenase NAD-binding domain-containing protein [Sulfitobacter sp.]